MGYPAGVSQRTWSTTVPEPITTALLRANVTSPLWLLSSPPMAILAQQNNAASIPNTTVTPVNMDTEILDTTNGHPDTGNTSRWYAAVPGWYLVKGSMAYAANANNQQFGFTCGVQIFTVSSSALNSVDGGTGGSTASEAVIQNAAELAVLNTPSSTVTSNDYCRIYAYQNTGAARSLLISKAAGIFPVMSVRWAGTVTGTTGLPAPSNPGYADTTEITGAFLNANLRDAVNFLSFPPMARLTAASGQAIPSQAFPAGTAVTFQSSAAWGTSSSSDNYSGWSSSTNPSRYTFPAAGRYYVYGQVPFAAANASQWAAGLRVNGGTTQWGTRMGAPTLTSYGQTPTAEQYIRANAGDYVELMASQNSGAGNTLRTGQSTSKMIVLWEGS